MRHCTFRPLLFFTRCTMHPHSSALPKKMWTTTWTLPETNSSHLPESHPKRKSSIFRCYVSFREGSEEGLGSQSFCKKKWYVWQKSGCAVPSKLNLQYPEFYSKILQSFLRVHCKLRVYSNISSQYVCLFIYIIIIKYAFVHLSTWPQKNIPPHRPGKIGCRASIAESLDWWFDWRNHLDP